MKNVLLRGLMVTVCLLLAHGAIQAFPGGGGGKKGVEDGSVWKNSSGHQIEVGVEGTIHGDQNITVTEGTNSGTGLGTPDPDGGCADSEVIDVGGEKYRVEKGKMQWKNKNGKWVNMHKAPADDLGFVGSLPKNADVH